MRRTQDDIKIFYEEITCGGQWILLDYNRGRRQSLLNTVINILLRTLFCRPDKRLLLRYKHFPPLQTQSKCQGLMSSNTNIIQIRITLRFGTLKWFLHSLFINDLNVSLPRWQLQKFPGEQFTQNLQRLLTKLNV